jgi:16S rRNA processing protein RimM
MAEETLLHIGKVIKVHGIRGELKVFPYSGQPESWLKYQRLVIEQQGRRQEHRISKVRLQNRLVLVQLEDIHDRSQAEQLIQSEVLLVQRDLPTIEAEGYYLHQLDGKRAVDEGGLVLGRINGFLLDKGQDLMRLERVGGEALIPVVKDFIVEIGGEQVVLRLPPGLLDIND